MEEVHGRSFRRSTGYVRRTQETQQREIDYKANEKSLKDAINGDHGSPETLNKKYGEAAYNRAVQEIKATPEPKPGVPMGRMGGFGIFSDNPNYDWVTNRHTGRSTIKRK